LAAGREGVDGVGELIVCPRTTGAGGVDSGVGAFPRLLSNPPHATAAKTAAIPAM
jgi:hypothetical protein